MSDNFDFSLDSESIFRRNFKSSFSFGSKFAFEAIVDYGNHRDELFVKLYASFGEQIPVLYFILRFASNFDSVKS